ncbi:MAG TPA: NAD(P)/FAD-dependent oxidoreductase [Candidatus Omnitrophica bacterium]|nr:NAD(P)/FAD-dependent oxidoreductase [Candidatus Omnitrophota bacterium]
MSNNSQNTYDAVIIGAGIGGLVCGCYLAKAGMKVLICEQHHKPGGYCTSFKRKGFTFDAAADCFGAYRKDGITRKVFKELGIDKKLNIIRFDPPFIIITPDHKITFWNDLEKTIKEYQAAFPEEGDNIRNFFYFFLNSDAISFSKIKNWTFKNLLDSYFANDRLKAVLSFPLLAMVGLPPSMMSGFMGGKLFFDFMLDGGYYPIGGMQTLSDALVERFKEFGGELRLSSPVKKIRVRDNSIAGIVTENDDFIPSRFVISNCDARQTFLKLLGKEKVDGEFYKTIKNMMPSISNFIAYLGVDKEFKPPQPPGSAVFFSQHYDLDKAYQAAQRNDFEGYGGYSFRISYNKSTIYVIIPAAFKNMIFWNDNKARFLELLIEKIEKSTIPNLSEHIVYQEAATPYTLYRYTLNYQGASYGWASIPSQLAVPGLRKPPFIQGLYLTGHWTTLGLGIPGVLYIGYDTSKLILKKEKNRL